MKKIRGWWFTTTEKCLLNGDGRPIVIGKTHKVTGNIIPCKHGLHLSRRIIDALHYAPGPVVYLVDGSGIIVPHGDPVDKYACSERTYVSGGIDVSSVLRKFARMCALDVISVWDAPEIVVRFLRTGDESIRDAAWDAARAAVWSAARDAAWAAAWAAARDAERDAAWAAAKAAAKSAARDAARKKQNDRLDRMIRKLM